MRNIKLHFRDENYLKMLLSDSKFQKEIKYLNPYFLNNFDVVLFDPIGQHEPLDTEMVVLSIFARAIKKIIFPNSNYNIDFLNPFLLEQKGGLIHNGEVIIVSTDLERFSIRVTIEEIM